MAEERAVVVIDNDGGTCADAIEKGINIDATNRKLSNESDLSLNINSIKFNKLTSTRKTFKLIVV